MNRKQNKYLTSITIAMRYQLSQRGLLIGRLLLYGIIVYLFYQVFQSVNAPPARVWYVAITEWFTLSSPPLAFRIAEDVNTGQMAYFRLRPMHYLSLRFCDCIGVFIVQFLLLGFACISMGYYLTDFFPNNIKTWCLGILFGLLGAGLYTLISVLIGLTSVWIKDIKTLVYLNLTATFCFGGLIVPLGFYSDWMRYISFTTPYPWILWWPAETMTGSMVNTAAAFLGFSIWAILLTGAIMLVYQRCIKSLTFSI